MSKLVNNAAGQASNAAQGYAAQEGGKALGGAVTDQAQKFMNENMLGDVQNMASGDVAGVVGKAGTQAVKGIATDTTKRLTDAGGKIMDAGEQTIEQGWKMLENVMDAGELAKLMEDMGEWAEKHPKLAVLGIPKLVLGVPGMLLFSFFTVLIFILSLVLALVLALVVSLLVAVVLILFTLLILFPLFFVILFVGIFGVFWGLLFYFMVVKKVKNKYGHLIPDAESFNLPNAPTHGPGQPPMFKKGTKHKLPPKKKRPNAAMPQKKGNSKKGKSASDFPSVPQHEPGQAAKATGSQPKPFKRGTKQIPKKRVRQKENPIPAK